MASDQESRDMDRCPNCDESTNKFVGECENCGHNRWTEDESK